MIFFCTQSGYEHFDYMFVDGEILSRVTVKELLEVSSFHNHADGEDPWVIEGFFPEAGTLDTVSWDSIVMARDFFTFNRKKWVPHDERDGTSRYFDIRPTDAFAKFPVGMLERIAKSCREEIENPENAFDDDDPEIIFTPLFERRVEQIKQDRMYMDKGEWVEGEYPDYEGNVTHRKVFMELGTGIVTTTFAGTGVSMTMHPYRGKWWELSEKDQELYKEGQRVMCQFDQNGPYCAVIEVIDD